MRDCIEAYMAEPFVQQATRFGGPWTEVKLGILRKYLDAYTTALKKQPFRLVYIDAFAGSGKIEASADDSDARKFISGSAEIAIGIDNRRFDRLLFVDKNPGSCKDLSDLSLRHPQRDIEIGQFDANTFIEELKMDWREWRGVVFLDPFATEVWWESIRRISEFEALDMWLLFPTSAISRILPRSRRPDDVDPKWSACLNRIYGNDCWSDLYRLRRQRNLFGDEEFERDRGERGLLDIYKRRLRQTFGKRFLDSSRPLCNSTGRPIFELLFCVGNPRGIGPASRIAEHLLTRI